jgi:hypothetical protein
MLPVVVVTCALRGGGIFGGLVQGEHSHIGLERVLDRLLGVDSVRRVAARDLAPARG